MAISPLYSYGTAAVPLPNYSSVPSSAVASTRGGAATLPLPSATAIPGVSIRQPSMADIQSTAEAINQMNVEAQKRAQAARVPGGEALEAQSSELIGQELAGQVPEDVIALLQQQAAERGIATGMPGSANANAAYLRALGLTSLQQQRTGQEDLSAAYGRSPIAQTFDPSMLLMTPAQQAQLELESAQLQERQAEALRQYGLDTARFGLEQQRYYSSLPDEEPSAAQELESVPGTIKVGPYTYSTGYGAMGLRAPSFGY